MKGGLLFTSEIFTFQAKCCYNFNVVTAAACNSTEIISELRWKKILQYQLKPKIFQCIFSTTEFGGRVSTDSCWKSESTSNA
jgi:hypothetical protein